MNVRAFVTIKTFTRLLLLFAGLFVTYGTLTALVLDGGNVFGLWSMNSWIAYPAVALGLIVLVRYYATAGSDDRASDFATANE